MKVEITITAKDNENGWDKEHVDKVIEFDVLPGVYYPVGDLVENLLQQATTERKDKLDKENAEDAAQ